MNSIKSIARLNDAELQNCTPPNASWHTDYRDTAYIHIGGLPFELSEGDVLLIFSQYGSPVHINLVRDKDNGKSRGFAFLKYEDQRSCDLAVDNLSGASVLGRVLSVDHARYKMKEGERETVGEEENELDGQSDRRKRRRTSESEGESEEEARPMIKEEVELQQLLREHDEDDPMKAYLVQEKRAEVEEALKAVTISKSGKTKGEKDKHRHHHHRSRRDDLKEDGKTRRNGHRSRRKDGYGEEDGGGGDDSPHRKRDVDRDQKSNGHRSRREHESRGENDRKHRRKRNASSSSNEATDRRTEYARGDGDANFLNNLSARRRKEDD